MLRKNLVLLLILFTLIPGCSQFPKVDQSGGCFFEPQSKGAKTVGQNKENEMLRNTTDSRTTNSSDSPWQSTSSKESKAAPQNNINVQEASAYYNVQRPNGAVLFPKLNKMGPLVVLEPKNAVAPVGEELVLVASYVGVNNLYLRTDESIQWSLDGVGHFLTSNPGGCFQHCDFANTKVISDRVLETVTTSRLWRIHRGTTTPSDDISILRGQSWTTLQSNQEGTSTVTILASNIDNWNNRTATATIHWLDALFLFPKSGVAPAGQPQTFSTSVVRKGNPAEGRKGWTVRYELLSGPQGGFGPQMVPAIELATDANGQANVVFTPKETGGGTNQILVKILKPSLESSESILAAEKQITQTWTSDTFFNLKIEGPQTAKKGVPANYRILVTNLTSTPQDAVVRLPLPAGARVTDSVPPFFMEQGLVKWSLENVPPRNTQVINFNAVSESGFVDWIPSLERKSAAVPSAVPSGQGTIPGGQGSGSGTGSQGTPPKIGQGATGSPANIPPSLPTNTPPVTAGPPTPGSFRLDIVSPFPKSAPVNQPFTIAFKVANPIKTNLNELVLDTVFPPGVSLIYQYKEGNNVKSERYGTSPIDFGTIKIADLLDKTYPLTFASTTTGTKQITLRARTVGAIPANQTILATYTGTVNITNAPSAATKTPPRLTINIQPRVAGAPQFAAGTPVPFVITIKNNENYAVSGLRLFCTPELNREVRPWTFVESTPTAAVETKSSGSWSMPLQTLSPNSELNATMTFKPGKAIPNGTFTVEVQSDAFPDPLGNKSLFYTIVSMRANRPIGNNAVETKPDEKITEEKSPEVVQKSQVPEAPADNTPVDKTATSTPPANKTTSESSLNTPVTPDSQDSQNLQKEQKSKVTNKEEEQQPGKKIAPLPKTDKATEATEQAKSTEPAKSTESIKSTGQIEPKKVLPGKEMDKGAEAQELYKVNIMPRMVDQHGDYIINTGIKGKENTARPEKDRTWKGQTFTYRIVLKNREKKTIPTDSLELKIAPPSAITFLGLDEKDSKFTANVGENNSIVLHQNHEIGKEQELEIRLQFTANEVANTTIGAELVMLPTHRILELVKLPLPILSENKKP